MTATPHAAADTSDSSGFAGATLCHKCNTTAVIVMDACYVFELWVFEVWVADVLQTIPKLNHLDVRFAR